MFPGAGILTRGLLLCCLTASGSLAEEFDIFTYRVVGDSIEITGVDRRSFEPVVVPAEIAGLPVTTIGKQAFAGCGSISITLPEGITDISEGAFEYLRGLQAVSLPSTVVNIGPRAFSGCSSLAALDLPEDLVTIGGSAFRDCGRISQIHIPTGVTSIGELPFELCRGLASLTVDPANSHFAGDGAVVLDSNHTTIIQVAAMKEGSYTVPATVTTIEPSAFAYCSRLTSIVLPPGMQSIGENGFLGCSGLTGIDLPEGVEFGRAAFSYCSSLQNLTIKAFGLITDDDDGLILRLSEGPDHAAFRRDVLEDPDKLLNPTGIGRHLQMARKAVSVSGSLTLDLWDEELVKGIIELGLPILFLPHTGTEPLAVGNPAAMEVLPELWRSAPGPQAQTSLRLPPIDWFEAHTRDIRRRLHHLPGTGSYQFAILQVLHQLGDVCSQIAHYAGKNATATPEQVRDLFWDLHARTFRGITLGVAALAWHCLGFDPGCPRKKALKALKDLRTKGPMSRSDVRRYAHLEDKEERDVLLERLGEEDLVRVEGRMVTATTFDEFVDALHSRPELPEADD